MTALAWLPALPVLLVAAALPCAAQQSGSSSGINLGRDGSTALAAVVPAGMADRPFTVAVSLGSAPDDFRDEKGEIVGWEIDILRASSQSLGLKLDLRPTTFDSLIPGLQAHRFDAAVGQMGVSVAREKVVDMVGTLFSNELFAAPADSPLTVKTLDDLCGLTVATTRGSREMLFAEEHQARCAAAGRKPINTLAFGDGNGAAEAMMSRRADLFWLGSTAVRYFVEQTTGRTKIVGSYTDVAYIGVALPKGSTMAAPLQAAVQHLIDDGTYGRILSHWGLQGSAVRQAPLNPDNVQR